MKEAEDARYKNVTRGSTGFPSKPFSIPCRSRSWIFSWMTEAYSSLKNPPAMGKMRCQPEFKSHLHPLLEPFVDFLLEAQSFPKPPPAMGKMGCQPELKSHLHPLTESFVDFLLEAYSSPNLLWRWGRCVANQSSNHMPRSPGRSDDKTADRPPRFYLPLRKWYDLRPEMEFWGFVQGVYVCICDESLFCRLLDVKHTENKDGKPVLFLFFEYMTLISSSTSKLIAAATQKCGKIDQLWRWMRINA